MALDLINIIIPAVTAFPQPPCQIPRVPVSRETLAAAAVELQDNARTATKLSTAKLSSTIYIALNRKYVSSSINYFLRWCDIWLGTPLAHPINNWHRGLKAQKQLRGTGKESEKYKETTYSASKRMYNVNIIFLTSNTVQLVTILHKTKGDTQLRFDKDSAHNSCSLSYLGLGTNLSDVESLNLGNRFNKLSYWRLERSV